MDTVTGPITDSIVSTHPGGWHNVAYRRWEPDGLPKAEVFCLHGFNRTSADFVRLAEDLQAMGCAVTAPDLVGRGDSDWLSPLHYHPLQYFRDVKQLISEIRRPYRRQGLAHDLWRRAAYQPYWPVTATFAGFVYGSLKGLRGEQPPVVVIGTSLGGILGMMLAAQLGSVVDYLVLNDIGPEIPADFIASVQEFALQRSPVYEDESSAYEVVREFASDLGPLTDDEWEEFVDAVLVCDEAGCRVLSDERIYDPVMHVPRKDLTLWALWTHVVCPTLVLRGENSPVLRAETARVMAAKAMLVEIPEMGHAPTLLPAGERQVITDWLHSQLPTLAEL